MDPTHAPTPAEIRTIADPRERYHAARAAEALMKRELSEIGRDVVNDLHKGGMNGPDIAALLGITRQRVSQLLDPALLAEARDAALAEREMNLATGLKQVRKERRKVAAKIGGEA